ncbi:MAG: M15 family metallopeptidase [Pseudomonadales bacterium]|nr:M15 family metallopeptidase [Pseudomonadales bacterium]
MKRRRLLKFVSAGVAFAAGGQFVRLGLERQIAPVYEDTQLTIEEIDDSIRYLATQAPDAQQWIKEFQTRKIAGAADFSCPANATPAEQSNLSPVQDALAGNNKATSGLQTYLSKMQNFEDQHKEDVYLDRANYLVLVSTFKRLERVQNLVGHGNFNVVSFDQMRKYGQQYKSIGDFTGVELNFLEKIFAENANQYGFYGDKVTKEITESIASHKRVKVPSTGHFLFKGDSYGLYKKVYKELGGNIFLTSGIRSIVKQTHLFFAKTIQSRGNLSRASRSLAPPGHSFHAVGDFDVGKVGLGARNFTSDFAKTDEFRKLVDLGYISMRYPQNNLLGVRYEPWHIKVS